MIVKIHKRANGFSAKPSYGKSFQGLAAYLLHDKDRAKTAERVEWTETRNLETIDGHKAARVMAYVAMDQARLKREAGVKSTGRKPGPPVLHLTLSWKLEEGENLTREEMIQAANGAIRALRAEDRQALLVSHSDRTHRHVHLMLNRVSSQDGRTLSSSYEKKRLQAWALAYEKRRGKIYCEQRLLNAEARARGQFIRAPKEKPRHIYELEARAANDNLTRLEWTRAEQRAKDKELRRKAAAIAARQKQEWTKLEEKHAQRRVDILRQARRQTTIARDQVAKRFEADWRVLHHAQEAERDAFVSREATVLGKAQNALKTIDWKGLLRSERRSETIREAFGVLSSSGARNEALRRSQEAHARDLEKRQDEAARQAAVTVRQQRDADLQQHRERLFVERQGLVINHELEDAQLRADWRERRVERQAAFEALRTPAKSRSPEAGPAPAGAAHAKEPRERPKSEEQLRYEAALERIERIDRERMTEDRELDDGDRGRERGR